MPDSPARALKPIATALGEVPLTLAWWPTAVELSELAMEELPIANAFCFAIPPFLAYLALNSASAVVNAAFFPA